MNSRISYRQDDKGGGVKYPADRAPNYGVLNKSTITLLVHGYNNTAAQADSSYERFIQLQDILPPSVDNIVGVYWPGDNWEGPLFYMQAIGKVKRVAPLLARDIYTAAALRGYLNLNFIAHSLGCRLALETIKEIQKLQQIRFLEGLHIGKVILMAGAVPTVYLDMNGDVGNRLRGAIDAFDKAMSIYSEMDTVLHYAFPIGETFGGERFFPTALGRRQWIAGQQMHTPLRQERNSGGGHSDYWGGTSKNETSLRQVAELIKSFINLGAQPSRLIGTRAYANVRDIPVRLGIQKRVA